MTEPRLHLRGVVLPDGVERDVFVGADGLVSFDAARGDARTVVDGSFLTPGLVDAHGHLTIGPGATAVEDAVVRSQAQANLAAGVLLVREPGGGSHMTAGLTGEPGVPRLQSAGRWLAGLGVFVPGWGREVAEDDLADAAVEELETAGGGWPKGVGDWRSGEGFGPSFRPETLADAVREVHEAGGRMAIHAILAETVDMAVAAGATRSNMEPLPPDVPVRAEAGATLLAGTDVVIPHGQVRREVELLASAGIPAEAALAAGSWGARAFLGLPGIEEGATADLVAYASDPREDLSALAEPVAIVFDGRLVEPARR